MNRYPRITVEKAITQVVAEMLNRQPSVATGHIYNVTVVASANERLTFSASAAELKDLFSGALNDVYRLAEATVPERL